MGFDSLMDILRKAQARYPALGKRLVEAEALSRWDTAVGPAIAKHSRAVRIQDAVIWVEVDNPIWKSELHHRKRQILDILNKPKSGAIAPLENSGKPEQAIVDIFFVDARGKR